MKIDEIKLEIDKKEKEIEEKEKELQKFLSDNSKATTGDIEIMNQYYSIRDGQKQLDTELIELKSQLKKLEPVEVKVEKSYEMIKTDFGDILPLEEFKKVKSLTITETEAEINKLPGVMDIILLEEELYKQLFDISQKWIYYKKTFNQTEMEKCESKYTKLKFEIMDQNGLAAKYRQLAGLQNVLSGHLPVFSPMQRMIQDGHRFNVLSKDDNGNIVYIKGEDQSKFANDPIDCYKYRDSDLTKGPKTLQHEKEHSLPSKLDDDWDKHNDEEEKIYGPEFVDVKLYINELFKLQLAGVDKTYKCTDFVKSDKPLKEVSVESEMERAIKRRGELFREGNHRKFLAENNITEEELQALPKSVASEKVIVDKRPRAECGCPETSQFFINKNNTYMRVCKDCKKKGNHLVNYVCDGCKIPQMNKKFAYLNKDNQPVCQLCK